MNFTSFIARRITFQSSRSFSRVIIRIAILAVVLSVAIMVISDAIVIGFQSEVKNKLTGFEAHIQVCKTRTNFSFENEPIPKDEAFEKRVSQINGVRHVQPFATKPGIIKTADAIEGLILKGFDKSADWSFFKDKLITGRLPVFSGNEASEDILISKALSEKLKLRVNDPVVMYFVQQPMRIRKFKVCGIYSTSIEEIDNVFAVVDLRHIRALNNWDANQIGGYEVFISDFNRLDQINNQVRLMADITQDSKTIRERYPQIFDWLGLLNVNTQIIFTLMAVVAAINMVTALIIMILERTQMIGLFKALGATDWRLQKIFIYNAMRLIGFGLVIGNGVAVLLLFIQKYLHVITLPEESYYVSEVPVYFNVNHILLINLGAFLFCSLCMLLPSLVVSRVKPVKALRFE